MNNKTHIVTGGTGFVGSKLISAFLLRGDNVIVFARSKKDISAQQRVFDILQKNGEFNVKNLKVYDIDLLNPIAGKQIDLKELRNSFSCVNDIWHLAAHLSFKDSHKDTTMKVNVDGTKHVASLAEQLNIPLYFFSTAYVHGKRNGVLKESELIKSEYNNFYEKSKFLAEAYINNKIKEGVIKAYIIRPSIIYDDFPVYKSEYLSGYYVLLTALNKTKESIIFFIKKHKYLSKLLGLNVTSNNGLSMRIIPVPVTNSKLNLIPVNILLKIILAVYDDEKIKKNGMVFHVVAPRGMDMGKVMCLMLNVLDIKAKCRYVPRWLVGGFINFLNKLAYIAPGIFGSLASKMSHYKFYLLNTMQFDMENIYKLVPKEEYDKMFYNQYKTLEEASYRFLKI